MKKIGILALVLVLAFSALGIGYAHWSQTLYVEGTVNTGSFNLGITEVSGNEKHIDPATGLKVDGEWEGKDVGELNTGFGGNLITDPITGFVGYEKAVFTITNAYPSYQAHITIAVRNLGTVPSHFKGISASGRNVTDGRDLTFEWLAGQENKQGVFKDQGVVIINLDVVNFVCIQLHSGEDTKGEFDLHPKQEIEQKHKYELSIGLEGVQWNVD